MHDQFVRVQYNIVIGAQMKTSPIFWEVAGEWLAASKKPAENEEVN